MFQPAGTLAAIDPAPTATAFPPLSPPYSPFFLFRFFSRPIPLSTLSMQPPRQQHRVPATAREHSAPVSHLWHVVV